MAKADKNKGKGKDKEKGKDELEVDEDKKGGSTKLIIIAAAALLCIGLGAIGMYFMMGGESADEQVAEGEDAQKQVQAIYYQLPKPFIVSFKAKGKQHYMQIKVAFMTRDQVAIDTILKHLPVVKNSLNQVFGSKELAVLQTYEGLQQLNKEATEAVQAFLEKETGSPGLERLLFVDFVMQ